MAYEGVIKFNYKCVDTHYQIPAFIYGILNPIRSILMSKKYIGVYADGISYGNISIRNKNTNAFYITASETGKFENAEITHFVEVTQCDIENNICTYKGTGLPSSESLSHFIIYAHCPEVQSVIHIHDSKLWRKLYNKVPTSSSYVTYGSINMVNEIINLLQNTTLNEEKFLVMGGHEDGLICFGNSIEDALLNLNKRESKEP